MFNIDPINASIASLSGALGRRLVPWRAVGSAIYDRQAVLKRQASRARLHHAVRFAAAICDVRGLNQRTIELHLNDDQQSDGCVVQALNQPNAPLIIQLRSRLFTYQSAPVLPFVLAHEFGHILNGDTDGDKIKAALAQSQEVVAPSKAQQLEQAHQSHRVELAANATAVTLFPTIAAGVAAGITSFEAKLADQQEILRYLRQMTGLPCQIKGRDYRFESHPSPQLCIRALRMLRTHMERTLA